MRTQTNPHENKFRHRLVYAVAVFVAVVVMPVASSFAFPAETGQRWALLIGVEAYQNVSALKYTVNDVRKLREVLRDYGGYDRQNVLEITDDGLSVDTQPYSRTLKDTLELWLKKPGKHDSVFVYFSGHGFRDKDGKMYLAPLDFEKAKAATTGVSIDWLRQKIEACPAEFKLLAIDSCHAGSAKDVSAEDDNIRASAVGELFKKSSGVVTLASCRGDEKSQIWFEKQRSLYSYWFTEGLKGHADQDSDGQVDIDELHKYVSRRVTHTAKVRFPRSQTPVRIIGPRVIGVPAITRLQPQPIRSLLANMSEHIANMMEEHKSPTLGVLEFSDGSGLQDVLGGTFGLMGKFCSDEIERNLLSISQDSSFRIADRNLVRKALSEQNGFGLKDLSSPDRLASFSSNAGNIRSLAIGTIRSRKGPYLTLQCSLKDANNGDLVGVTGGLATLSENDYGMLGQSVAVDEDDRRPGVVAEGETPRPETEVVIDRFDQRTEAAHPLLDPEFLRRFNIEVKVDGQVRKGVVRSGDYIVPMQKGDQYSIRISNNSGKLVLMRLLVDGLDTTLKVSDLTKGIKTEFWAQPVTHLDDAGFRFLDPQGEELKGRAPVWEVMGFTTKTGSDGKIRQFEIVGAAESLAARQSFTEQIGLITVALYTPAGGERASLGTAAGAERDRSILTRKGPRPGNLIGVIHIRYADADAISLP